MKQIVAITTGSMVTESLRRLGYDGLCKMDESCGCSLKAGDLFSCGSIPMDCVGGYDIKCGECPMTGECRQEGERPEGQYCIVNTGEARGEGLN